MKISDRGRVWRRGCGSRDSLVKYSSAHCKLRRDRGPTFRRKDSIALLPLASGCCCLPRGAWSCSCSCSCSCCSIAVPVPGVAKKLAPSCMTTTARSLLRGRSGGRADARGAKKARKGRRAADGRRRHNFRLDTFKARPTRRSTRSPCSHARTPGGGGSCSNLCSVSMERQRHTLAGRMSIRPRVVRSAVRALTFGFWPHLGRSAWISRSFAAYRDDRSAGSARGDHTRGFRRTGHTCFIGLVQHNFARVPHGLPHGRPYSLLGRSAAS